MRVLVIGDPHAKLSNLREIEKLAIAIKNCAVQNGVQMIVVLGDLSNDFSKIHALVLRAITYFFNMLVSVGVPVYYVVGNHDMINNTCFLEDLHVFTPFKNWDNLYIIDSPIKFDGFIFCPYVSPGRFREAVYDTVDQASKTGSVKAIFCHQEFFGAKMGAIESTHGDVWDLDMPLVVSGHIHDRAWLQENILYVGAPMSQAYGESEDKTVSLLEFDDTKLVKETPIDLGMPKRTTLTLSVDEAKKFKMPPNTYVRINLVDTVEKITAFKKTDKYDELTRLAKVVPKPSDKVYARVLVERASYMEILKQACVTESESVKNAYDELSKMRN